ncbi:hypothetical protein MN0502_29260 [Arthrobacter sp. MN05-02]|nr:hypothetical protein MN0502_29260 [Arthrobacter sp. MN05-02]
MSRQRIPLLTELPLVVWLVLVWGALWQDFGAGNLVFGAIIAYGIVNFFYLRPVELTGRFNVLWLLPFIGRFLLQLVAASVQVFWLAISKGPSLRNAVVAVELRSHSDFLVTATGHAISLIPGSLVLEVDRSTSTLYLHCLDIETEQHAEAVRTEVLATEAWLIRIMGSRADLAALRSEEARR